jgi:hypothetical protein
MLLFHDLEVEREVSSNASLSQQLGALDEELQSYHARLASLLQQLRLAVATQATDTYYVLFVELEVLHHKLHATKERWRQHRIALHAKLRTRHEQELRALERASAVVFSTFKHLCI